jgi:hypothetical protein
MMMHGLANPKFTKVVICGEDVIIERSLILTALYNFVMCECAYETI